MLCAILFNSCDSKSEKESKELNTSPIEAIVSNPIPKIYLDSLLISDTDFERYIDSTKKDNIVFGYFLTDTAVTLRGWVLVKYNSGNGGAGKDTGSYFPNQYITLIPKARTSVTIGPNTLLSDQVLLDSAVKKILRKIRNRSAELHFKPFPDPTTSGITYKIRIKFLDKKPGDPDFVEEGYTTNPAPPRQAYD